MWWLFGIIPNDSSDVTGFSVGWIITNRPSLRAPFKQSSLKIWQSDKVQGEWLRNSFELVSLIGKVQFHKMKGFEYFGASGQINIYSKSKCRSHSCVFSKGFEKCFCPVLLSVSRIFKKLFPFNFENRKGVKQLINISFVWLTESWGSAKKISFLAVTEINNTCKLHVWHRDIETHSCHNRLLSQVTCHLGVVTHKEHTMLPNRRTTTALVQTYLLRIDIQK